MKKVVMIGLVFSLALILAGPLAFAESSGNFSAKINTTQCVINENGTLSQGIVSTILETTIRTPGSQSTALLIRPSLVTGLYTKTKVTETITSATAYAGIKVRVWLGDNFVAPGTAAGNGWVYYDKRWQQINQNFLGQIELCTSNPLLDCGLELILSTLSAHSIDFVAGDVGVGEHRLKVEWAFEDSNAVTPGSAAACVGPAVLTVQQVKTFSTGGGIVIE